MPDLSQVSLMADAKLMIVEDDHSLREDLRAYFSWRGSAVLSARSAEEFWRIFDRLSKPDIVLLDLGLPGMGGLEVARQLRQESPETGLVILTALGTDAQKIAGLDAGGDAYLVKGVSLEVLEATCASVLRRVKGGAGASLAPAASEAAKHWQLNPIEARLQTPKGQSVQLTHLEQIFLSVLMAQPGSAVARSRILASMGRPEDVEQLRALDGCAARLRRKVQALVGEELPIRSFYGRGYAFGAPAIVSSQA